jgi:hypothetical protein
MSAKALNHMPPGMREPDLGETSQARELAAHMLPVTVVMRVPDAEALALAQFVKRVGWREIRENAIDDAEAYEIRAAIYKLQTALAECGFAPR